MKPAYLLSVALSMLLTVACSKTNELDEPTQPTPPTVNNEITLNESELVLSDTDTKGMISFKATADWHVNISDSRAVPGWVTVEPMSGKAGQATLTVTAQANNDYDDRNAVITISSGAVNKAFSVFQKKKNALILSKEIFELTGEQSTIDVEVKTNVDFEVKILDGWITQVQSRGLTTHQLKFAVAANEGSERTGKIVFNDNNSSLCDTISVVQTGMVAGIAQDREALISLYKSTGGDYWKNNDNWCSDKPLNQWYGVSINENGRVISISLLSNNLSGSIPEEVKSLSELKTLDISYNRINEVSENIGYLTNLQSLYIVSDASAGIEFTGSIPNSLSNLKNLKTLHIAGNFSSLPEWFGELSQLEELNFTVGNRFIGSIPEWIGKLSNLKMLDIAGDNFTSIPESIGKLTKLTRLCLCGDFASLPNLSSLKNLECFNLMGGKETKSPLSGSIPEWIGTLTNLKSLGISYFNISGEIPEFIYNLTNLEQLYLNNMNLTGNLSEKIGNLKNLTYLGMFSNKLSGPLPQSITSLTKIKSIDIRENDFTGNIPQGFDKLTELYLLWLNGNRLSGKIPDDFDKNPNFDKWQLEGGILTQQYGYVLSYGTSYESTDFSSDGQVMTLQKATTGKGVDIVLLGDGFVDRDMASGGKYEQAMQEACEYLFALEPMKSYREYFNVYAVKVVSKHERFGAEFETALGVTLGADMRFVYGNHDECFKYAEKAPIHTIDEITIAVIGNTNSYGGTAFWFGSDAAVCYSLMPRPISEEYAYQKTFESVFIHEVVGHGFGKLADEYVYVDANFPVDAIEDEEEVYEKYGWNANISYTSEPEKVRWSHLLKDVRFSSYTGIIEGGNNFAYGVWRPEEQSMMRAQLPYFNAPSREAIVKRIMRLAGEEYSFEKFAAKDKYEPIGTRSRSSAVDESEIVHNPSPVIVRR